MKTYHALFLVEDASTEAFLSSFLLRLTGRSWTFEIHAFGGKRSLMKKIEPRLKGLSWLPQDHKIIVILDRDRDDCSELAAQIDMIAQRSGFNTRRANPTSWRHATCIAIEELEAWFFGDWEGVRGVFPRVPIGIPNQARYRAPDAIENTWESFERVMQKHGYFRGGLEKVRAAQEIGTKIDAARNTSPSFQHFWRVLNDL